MRNGNCKLRIVGAPAPGADGDLAGEIEALKMRKWQLRTLRRLQVEVATMEQSLLIGTTEAARVAQAITQVVCDEFCVAVALLTGRSREAHVALPRQVAFYLLREYTPATLAEIGRAFGRDHGTVLSGAVSVRHRLETDGKFREVMERLGVRVRERVGRGKEAVGEGN